MNVCGERINLNDAAGILIKSHNIKKVKNKSSSLFSNLHWIEHESVDKLRLQYIVFLWKNELSLIRNKVQNENQLKKIEVPALKILKGFVTSYLWL